MIMKKYIFGTLLAIGLAVGFSACDDDDEVYSGDYLTFAEDQSVLLGSDNVVSTVQFTSKVVWSIEAETPVSWLTFTPTKGSGGVVELELTATANGTGSERTATLIITALDQQERITVTQVPGDVVVLDPADIPDYDKFFHNSDYGGDRILRSDSKMSFCRSAQSEHFFVFWDAYFGDDPNGENVPAEDRVDIDDLLAKAEHFFDTNINQLGMSVLGQGKSYLDQYKMQIYLLDPTPEWWVATGSGYDNTIGALWVTPATCQPVGSTIAHEIGHSFQYQTYCDKLLTGAPDDMAHGFRYGFVGPDGSGNGGCAYWEQCAQWQAQRDYPEEQFTTYNYPVWLANCHRHFHHEWQRYASYWLQSYWVEKHGVEAYGRIWRESEAPEDAIAAYTRIYNGGDYGKTREELFDYAMRMATYDIAGAREYADGYQDRYTAKFVRDAESESYYISYANCPGATGFNVVPLAVPDGGGKVSVEFTGLPYGAPLADKDAGEMVDGDGKVVGKATNYNAVGGAENMGWRYGFVAFDGTTRTYGDVGKDANGTLSFDVPAGTTNLWLVVQGSPEVYMSHGWDEDGSNDPQFPYAVKFTGTDLREYAEAVEAVYTVVDDTHLEGTYDIEVSTALEDWVIASYDVSADEVLSFFGLSYEAFENAMVQPVVGEKVVPAEGKIVVLNENADGTRVDMPTANLGYWCDNDGNAVGWGNGQTVYYELSGTIMSLGQLAGLAAAGDVVSMRPVFVYTSGGQTKELKLTVTYHYK